MSVYVVHFLLKLHYKPLVYFLVIPFFRSRSKHTAESDSDDDFYDSSEEEEDLLNTFIIIGKTGCGSTAAVYACTQELGYKVNYRKKYSKYMDIR